MTERQQLQTLHVFYSTRIHRGNEKFDLILEKVVEIRALGKAGWTEYDEVTFNGVTMHFYRHPKLLGSFKNI